MPPEEREYRFWMVYVEGKAGSKMKHPSNTSAFKEAERLACLNENRNRRVFVLETIFYCHTSYPVTWERLEI